MDKSKKRKVVKIEDIVRDNRDFLDKPKLGKYEIRAKYANRKVDVPLEDKLRFIAKKKNICITCHNEATKMVYLSIKGGGLQLERYCRSCFDLIIDVQKMEMRSLDNSHILEKITIKPSEGGIRSVEEWRHLVKKGTHF